MEQGKSKGRCASLAFLLVWTVGVVVALATGVVPAGAGTRTPAVYLPFVAGAGVAGPTAPAATPTPSPTPSPTPTAGPFDQAHLAWTGDTATTLTVTWRTWQPETKSAAQYRLAGSDQWQTATGTTRTSGTQGQLHEVTLTGLTPGAAYEYRVQTDGNGWSPAATARTAPRGPAAFDAVFFADTGIAGRTDGLASGTQQVIDEIGKLDPLVLLGGGDYAYFDKDKRFGTLDATIDAWFNQMAPVASRAPMMLAYGNHEADPARGEQLGPWAQRLATPPRESGLYDLSFDVGDVHFIAVFAPFDYTGVTDQQLAWLDADMSAAKARGMRWLIPYFHVPLFGDGTNHGPNLMLRDELGPLFEKQGVKLALVAHDQSYERSYPLADVPKSNRVTSTSPDCYTPSDGVVYMKVSPAGKESNISGEFSPFASATKPAWTAVRDNTMHHFARLRFSADGVIAVEAYGFKPGGVTPPVIVDRFKITAGSCP